VASDKPHDEGHHDHFPSAGLGSTRKKAGEGGSHRHPDGARRFPRSVLHLHRHDTTERVDSALETSRQGIRAVKVSLLALGLTAAIEAVVVGLSGSVSLLGDTLHNFTDALTALPLWLAFALGRRPPTRRYTYGFGRAEDLAGIVIVAAIAGSTVAAAYESVTRLIHPRSIDHLWAVGVAAAVGVVGNELVAVYRMRVGRSISSAALQADGRHARTDGLSSLAVLVGTVAVAAGAPLADPAIGLGISVLIFVVLLGAARDVFRRLMDAVDPGLVDAAERVIARVEGVVSIDEVRIRWIGHSLRAEVVVAVDAGLTVAKAHDVAEEAHHTLLHELPRLASATVHVDPHDGEGSDPHAGTAHHRPRPATDRG
jgi:cation diffusion facilitator family transporter